ncbi:MAG: UxaA family hydrolase [Gemmatimonadetes bacterium]|nr:UxaA family hydrolase [Gemmatimonadota bacterium]
MGHKFLVHAPGDSVGVAVEPIRGGETVEGVVLEDDSTVRLKAADDIPLGHKIALAAVKPGDPVVKYGEPVGRATAAIAPGTHVHAHNLKSARW